MLRKKNRDLYANSDIWIQRDRSPSENADKSSETFEAEDMKAIETDEKRDTRLHENTRFADCS
jgi:hypothetical protein